MRTTTRLYQNQNWNESLPDWDSDSTLVLAFSGRSLEAQADLWQSLKTQYPNSVIAGCSSSGEIFGDLVYDDTVSLAVTQFDHTRIQFAHVAAVSGSSFTAGSLLANSLKTDDLTAVLLLSDGLNVNGSELVRGMVEGLPKEVVVTGGLAGDGANFERTWTLVDGQPTTATITAIGFYGNRIRVGYGSKGGWDLFGPERMVTKSDKNIVYELDNSPALALYKSYLGDMAAGLPATGLMFPLALKADDDRDPIVRTLLAIDEEKQSLIFAGDIPEGRVTQLMRANFDRLIDGATDAAEQIHLDAKGDHLSIAISCVGRKLILKDRIDEEVEATMDALPSGTHQVGFYSYGELSPSGDSSCRLHNQTMTLTVIAEV